MRRVGNVATINVCELSKVFEVREKAPGLAGSLRSIISPSTREVEACLLYTSDAADDLLCVDLRGRRIIQKKTYYATTP